MLVPPYSGDLVFRAARRLVYFADESVRPLMNSDFEVEE